MSDEERSDLLEKIHAMLEETEDSDLVEVYWYLKVFIT